jgi:uncharacterized coiled-coil DUF342 family protein
MIRHKSIAQFAQTSQATSNEMKELFAAADVAKTGSDFVTFDFV